jgi:hypothetical protein
MQTGNRVVADQACPAYSYFLGRLHLLVYLFPLPWSTRCGAAGGYAGFLAGVSPVKGLTGDRDLRGVIDTLR